MIHKKNDIGLVKPMSTIKSSWDLRNSFINIDSHGDTVTIHCSGSLYNYFIVFL